jgi:Heparinase II/III-like protein/Heparinase II/III N-terminus
MMWLHAARVVTPRQALARAVRPVRRRRFPAGPAGPFRPLAENETLWRSAAFAPLRSAPDGGSRLAGFQGHYGAEVLEAARLGADGATPARAWIAANPPRRDDAWHPYATATRVSNWLAASTLDPSLVPVVRDSLRRGLARVAANVEDDVLGNHVIRNAKALLLGGAAFDEAHLRLLGTRLLERELPAQVLPDGGHYERSPAYHRLVMRDLLEVAPFFSVDEELSRMTLFANASSRPDGHPALFNDGGLDLAPDVASRTADDGLHVFADTGYVFLRSGDLWLAFDCGPPSPPFLPAHAHADGLSFQLWSHDRPVVVDPGMPTYEAGDERDFFRSTAAHSTVAVGRGQFQSWGAFRAGPLPEVELLSADESALIGRVRVGRQVEHTRRIGVDTHSVTVEDTVTGADGRDIVSTLVLDAGATPVVEADAPIEHGERVLAERLGERVPASAVVQRGSTTPTWRLRLSDNDGR